MIWEAVLEFDDCLRSHLDFVKKNANCIFSRDIQNEIIDCIIITIEDEIKEMIKKDIICSCYV